MNFNLSPNTDVGGFFVGSQAVRQGHLTSHQLRNGAFRRVFRDVYTNAQTPDTHYTRAQAASLLLPDDGMIGGISAASVYGVDRCKATYPVDVLVPVSSTLRSRTGLTVRRTRRPDNIEWRHGVPLSSPMRTISDICVHHPVAIAAGYLDEFDRMGLLEREKFAEYCELTDKRTRVACRKVLQIASPGATTFEQSVLMTHLRAAGYVCTPNRTLRIGNDRLVTFDVAIEPLGIGVWCLPRDINPYESERRRETIERLRERGWWIIVVEAESIEDPSYLREALRTAVCASPRRPAFAV